MASTAGPDQFHGVTTFFSGVFDAQSVIVTVCAALTQYNAIELLLLIFTTFRKYSGLYFYAILVASLGLIPYSWGYLTGYFQLCNQLAASIISTIGWPAMVTGQSLVLFSRLRILLLPDYSKLHRGVLWMIVVQGIVYHVSTTVVMFGAFESRDYNFALAYRYIEKVQMTGFTIQEFILSAIYIWRTFDILRATAPFGASRQRGRKQVMLELLAINVWIVIMDIALLIVEYQNRHPIEQALKGVIYSIKLKLEFVVLNKLVAIAGGNRGTTGTNNGEFLTTWAMTDAESRRTTIDSSPALSKPWKGESASHVERAGSVGFVD